MKPIQSFFFSSLTALLLAVAINGVAQAADPGIADTVRIDSVAVSGVSNAQIPIRFYNDEELGGIEITIHHNSANITIDSVSYAGSRVASIASKGKIINGNNIVMYCLPFPSGIPAGSGLFARVYVSFASNLPEELITFDSVTVTISAQVHTTSFSTTSAESFKPKFQKGYLLINGSCCIGIRGNINGDAAQAITILDLSYLVTYMFRPGGPPPPCMREANVNGVGASDGPNIQDLTYLVSYMFRNGPAPVPCQ